MDTGDPQPRAEHVVEMLLLVSVVLALSGDLEAQGVPIELQAGLCIADDDGGMVDPQEQSVHRAMPFRTALPLRKLENLQNMTIRVFEIERLDSGGGGDVRGQRLRAGQA